MSKIEKYITANELDGKKIADVLRDYDSGRRDLVDICFFYNYDIDKAMMHINKIKEIA